jgi:hypothetical protein
VQSAPAPLRRIAGVVPDLERVICGVMQNLQHSTFGLPQAVRLRYTTETWNEQEFVQTGRSLIRAEVRLQGVQRNAHTICFECCNLPARPSATVTFMPAEAEHSGIGQICSLALWSVGSQSERTKRGNCVLNSYKSVSEQYLIPAAMVKGFRSLPLLGAKRSSLKVQFTLDIRK